MKAVLAAILVGAVVAHAEVASWYGEEHRGRPMANGRPFNPDALTVASWRYGFGTRLRVSHGSRSVVVTVTDRGPALWTGAQLDLSRAAFARLAPPKWGRIEVRVAKIRN